MATPASAAVRQLSKAEVYGFWAASAVVRQLSRDGDRGGSARYSILLVHGHKPLAIRCLYD